MANAKCCDICGKFYRAEDGFALNIVKGKVDHYGKPVYGYSNIYELCDECSDKVLDTIGKKKEDMGWE